MRTKKIAFTVALLILGAVALSAQQTFNTTIYFDYTYNLTNDGFKTLSQQDLNNKFNFRRAYFTYENKISDVLKFRFRYDADYITAVDAKGTKDDKLRPFLKHLYVDYAGLFPNSSLKIGMIETLTFKIAEDRWSYRSVAKTLTDNYKRCDRKKHQSQQRGSRRQFNRESDQGNPLRFHDHERSRLRPSGGR